MIELLQRLGYQYDAPFTWSAAILIAVGVLLVAWTVLPERWRRLGRPSIACPRCHYDLRGVVGEAAFPLTCAECGLEITAEKLKRKPRRVRRTVAVATLLVVAAHVTALWPQVKRVGPKRLIPSTILVLQPMDVGEWTDERLYGRRWSGELERRLILEELWSWQEWLLLQRVSRSCRARDNYGITPSQYDAAVRLRTTPGDPRAGETVSQRLDRLARSADLPFLVDSVVLSINGVHGDDLAGPAEPSATVARALDLVIDPQLRGGLMWDTTAEGTVVILWSKDASTRRSRIYDLSDLTSTPWDAEGLDDLIHSVVMPDDWVFNGGTVNSCFTISDHLVVVATTRVHFQIEELLDRLREAIAAGPPPLPPHVPPANPRQIEGCGRLLDDLRLLRTVPIESVRAAGPALDDGVTEEELDACGRAAFGLLDRIREPSPSPP